MTRQSCALTAAGLREALKVAAHRQTPARRKFDECVATPGATRDKPAALHRGNPSTGRRMSYLQGGTSAGRRYFLVRKLCLIELEQNIPGRVRE